MLLLTMNLVAQSKPTDSLKVSVPQLKKVLAAAEQKKVLEEQVTLLNQRIDGLNQIIKAERERDSVTVASYEAQLKVLTDQRALYDAQVTNLEKMYRKEKRKRFWTSAGGIALTAAGAYLYLTK